LACCQGFVLVDLHRGLAVLRGAWIEVEQIHCAIEPMKAARWRRKMKRKFWNQANRKRKKSSSKTKSTLHKVGLWASWLALLW
jgi:hypothetical protein